MGDTTQRSSLHYGNGSFFPCKEAHFYACSLPARTSLRISWATPCRNQTQPKRMIVREPPLVCHFLEQHQMRHGEIMGIIHNEALGPILVAVSHEFRLAGAPMPSQRES